MLTHLHYAAAELQGLKELLSQNTSSFQQRVLARAVFLRTLDFIKIGQRANNALNAGNPTLKNEIKEDLKALKDIFDDTFQTHRDKLSAHYQPIELLERIKLWELIYDIQKQTEKLPNLLYLIKQERLAETLELWRGGVQQDYTWPEKATRRRKYEERGKG